MSTLKNNITAKRIAFLASRGEQLFHIRDLANLWNISNANTLRVTLKRYTQDGILFRIYRGFYSLAPLDKLDPIIIGAKALHTFCYLSTESVLYREAYISQHIHQHTFVSSTSSRFTIGDHHFRSRQLSDRFLYNPAGVTVVAGYKIASPVRAICDMLYFDSHYHFDRPVDWQAIQHMQELIGYPITPHRYDPPASL